ncbi:helix-turn-helix domain-containing protein [Methylocapsa sp. S129]|uniref:helix-turn-helix domain-containing protein n=1 Tax=Methylocapsa sp. S129 TaxID=1641869 RepID=UPI00131B98CD|nr:helix-turn-helix domain-containing protein [Methylocapsa sp. S129]
MRSVQISTDAFPERSRLALWREVYGRNITYADVEPLDDRPFRASATFHELPGLGVAIDTRSDARYVFGKQAVDKTRDQLALALTTRGVGHIVQLGREVTSEPGGAVLVSGADPISASLRGDGICITLAFPRAALQALVPDLDVALVRPIHESNGALRLLIDYLGVLNDHEGAMGPALAHAFATHVLDLTALAVGAQGEAREIAAARGAKTARRRAIFEAIDASARAPDASAGAIAGKLGISERYLRLILEETGSTFSELLLERRLALAWRRLTDPQANHQTISEIAYSAGFSDISYFNRSFRRRFGDTPSGVRGSGRGAPSR